MAPCSSRSPSRPTCSWTTASSATPATSSAPRRAERTLSTLAQETVLALRARLLQEVLLVVCIGFGLLMWIAIGAVVAFSIWGFDWPLPGPILLLLTLPTWTLWAFHTLATAAGYTSPISRGVDWPLVMLCALL